MAERQRIEGVERLSCQDENVLVRPNMKERVKALREETILDAARELIENKGYAALTLDEVTDIVGISKPTLYLHFRSKEDLVRAVAQRCLLETMDYLKSLDPDKPAADRIRDFVRWAIDRRFGANSVLFQDLAQYILPLKEVGSPLYLAENEMIEAVHSLLAQAQGEGGIRKDIPPAILGAMLLAFVKYWRVDELLQSKELGITEITEAWMSLLTA